MPVSEIHHVAMIVSDLERSANFYAEGLGYRKTLTANVGGDGLETAIGLPKGVSGKIQYLQGPSKLGQMELIQWDGPAGIQQRDDHTNLGTLLLSFEAPLDEIGEVFERFVNMNADIVSGLTETELENFGVITAFSVRDPDRNLLEIVSLPTKEQIQEFRNSSSPESKGSSAK